MSKLKIRECTELYSALLKIKDEKLPISIGFAIALNMKSIEPVVTQIEASRETLLKTLCTKDEDGNPVILEKEENGQSYTSYSISNENIKTFNEEYEKLLDEEVELTLKKVSVEKFESALESTSLSPSELYGLMPMFEE